MKAAAAILLLAAGAWAQQAATTPAQPAPQQPPASLATVLHDSAVSPAEAASLATVSTEGVSLTGATSVANGFAFVGNNGAVTASDKTVSLKLTRGGNLNVCATTEVHLSTDTTVSGGGLMIALNRGALEGRYIPGEFSDVILTPDLRILISGPGTADFSLRVNNQGDTCFDNHGDHAPYVTATNLFEGGAYRVQPNQRVLFEHGSLRQVVDNEKESCGCPPPEPTPAPTAIARVGAPGLTLHTSNETNTPPPGARSTEAENPFPLAQSEGLKTPSAPPSTPAVPPGQAQAQVTVPLVYNGEAAANAGTPPSAASAPQPAASQPQAAPPAKPAKKHSAFVRFLRKVFG
jgi:hypothetical protein